MTDQEKLEIQEGQEKMPSIKEIFNNVRIGKGIEIENTEKESAEKENTEKESAEKENTEKESVEKENKDEVRIKTEKRLKETQEWGHSLSRKLKGFENQITKYIEDGSLTKEEGEALFNNIKHEAKEENDAPLVHYGKVWDNELENMRKYSNDVNIDNYVLAFQHLLAYGDINENQLMLNEFTKIDDPILSTKKMLKYGEDYYNETYGELAEAGGVKALTKKYKEKLKEQQKIIDKLKKDSISSEEDNDYIQSKTYKLSNSASKNVKSTEKDYSIKGIFNEFRGSR